MASFKITNKAKQDLRGIWIYTFDTWDERQADSYLKELMDEFSDIGKYPERGKSKKKWPSASKQLMANGK